MIDSLLAKWGNFVFLPFFLLSVVFVSEILSWSLDCVCVLSVGQSWPTLCDLKDCSPPGFSVHGISQARILEWVVIPFFRGSSQARDRTCISLHWQVDSLPLSHLGSPSWWGQWSWKLLKRNKNQHLFRVHLFSTLHLLFYPHNKRFLLFIAILHVCKL